MTRYEELKKEIREIEEEKDKLTIKQKELEEELGDTKDGEHTEESKEKLDNLRSELRGVQTRLSKLKGKKNKLVRKLEEIEGKTDKEELEARFEELSNEVTDLRQENKSLKKENKKLRDLRRLVRELLERYAKLGFPSVTRKVDEDRNIFSKTGASLWTGDLVDLDEKVKQLRELI